MNAALRLEMGGARGAGDGDGESRARKKRGPAMRWIARPTYRAYRLVSWFKYRFPRRYTPAGMTILCGIVLTGLTGVDTDNTVAYQAFALLFMLMLVGVAFLFRFKVSFSAVRKLPRFGTAGCPFQYSVMVRNQSAQLQKGLVLLEDLEDPRPGYEEWLAAQLAEEKHLRSFRVSSVRPPKPFKAVRLRSRPIPEMVPGGESEVRLELTPLRRGVLRFEGVTVARTDPLGLVRSFRRVRLPQSVLILPKRYPVPSLVLPGATRYQEGGVAFASNVGQSEEFVSLREYRRGDPLRHIHWRSWAKTGQPIVKEFEDEFFVRHALILDTFTAHPRSEAFEEAVSVAASFACTVLTQESLLDLLFVGPRAYCFTAGRGLARSDQMLEVLAAVQPCTDGTFDTLGGLVLDQAGLVSGCICVMLDWDEARQSLVRKLRMLGVPVLVIVIVERGAKDGVAPGVMSDDAGRFHCLELGRIGEDLMALR